jgi:hypothetical protein
MRITPAAKKIKSSLCSRSAVTSCRGRLIPDNIINLTMLKDAVRKVRDQALNNGWIPVLPVEKSSQLYSKQIATCVFGESKILITIRVPFKQTNSDVSLYRLWPIPFSFDNQICSINSEYKYFAMQGNATFPIASDDCDLIGGMCKISHSLPAAAAGECAFALLRGDSIKQIRTHCPFSCRLNTALTITRIENLIFVTNAKNITVRCGNADSAFPQNTTIGAVAITLGEHCVLYADGNPVLPSYPTANMVNNKNFTINIVIPGGWAKYDDAISSEEVSYKSIEGILDPEWFKHHVVYNHSHIPPIPEPLEWYGQGLFNDPNTIFYFYNLWLLVLTGIVGYPIFQTRYRRYLANTRNRQRAANGGLLLP